MRPHENMSARNAQVHSNDVFSTNETPFLIFGATANGGSGKLEPETES